MRMLEAIREDAYTIEQTAYYHTIELQLRAERLAPMIEMLSTIVRPPGFLMIETIQQPEQAAKSRYYLNGLQTLHFQLLFDMYRDLLLTDSSVRFGYGAHEGVDQIYINEFKQILIYTEEPDKYLTQLDQTGVSRREQLQTVSYAREELLLAKGMTLAGDTIDLMIETMQLYGLVEDPL